MFEREAIHNHLNLEIIIENQTHETIPHSLINAFTRTNV